MGCLGGGEMKAGTLVAVLLIVAGVLALAYGGFTMTTREKVVDLGPVEVTREDRERVPLPPVLGILSIGAGVLLLVVSGRKR
jgi:hypothetical protein